MALSDGPTDTVPPDVQATGIVYDIKLKATDSSAPWLVKIFAKPLGSEALLCRSSITTAPAMLAYPAP